MKAKITCYLITLLILTIIITFCCFSCSIPDTSDKTIEVQAEEIITVMTYNILNGAGVIPDFEKWAADHGYPGNRLSNVLEVINSADPDILAIEEASGWDRNDPSVIEQVAKTLGMNYYLGRCIYPESGFNHVALLTKFTICDAEDYPGHFTRAALRAEVITPVGNIINVFIAHLIHEGVQNELKPPHLRDIASSELQKQELAFLISKIEPYKDQLTIVIGDFNFFIVGKLGNMLKETGLKPIFYNGVDHIWASSELCINAKSLKLNVPKSTSDHLPVAGNICIY